MKNFCLRLALFVIMGIPLVFLFPQNALAKNEYGLTWTNIATPSAVMVDTNDNIYFTGAIASNSAAQMNPYYIADPTTQPDGTKTATTGGIFLTKINHDYSYNYSFVIEADDPKVVNGKPTSILLTKMATDSANNIYLLGSFNGNVNFNTTGTGPMDFYNSNGQTWQFLTEIKANGDYGQTYTWQSPYITLRDVAFDQNNNIYVAGMINDTTGTINVNLDIFAGTAPETLTNSGDSMVFYTKLGAAPSSVYDYSKTFVNTTSPIEVDHIALDHNASNPNVFLYGVFSGAVTFDGTAGPNASTKTSAGLNDIYLSEYADSGSSATYTKTYTIGDTGNETAGTLAIDNDNNVYYTGTFNGSFNFNPTGSGAADPHTATVSDQPFLTKLTGDTATYGYTLSWKANGLNIEKIAFKNNSLVYLAGESPTASPDINYNPTAGTPDPIHGFGGNDSFLTVLNTDGTYDYSYVWGGTDAEKTTDIALDSSYDFYIAGSTQSLNINFDPVAGTDPQTFTGGENGYITEFTFEQYVPPVQPPADNGGQNNNSNSGSSSSSNSNSTPTCGGSQPSAPSIFQIWATQDKATMHFVPSQSQQDTYIISYGLYSGADMYNVTFNYSDKSGAIPYTINALNSGTVYYFKVRANNGCMPGEWSNILSLRTAYAVGSTTTAYAYNSAINNSGVNVITGASCSQYTVRPGDSFWSIAAKLLGAGRRYFELWNANKVKFPSLNSSSIIRTGWTLSVGC